MIPVYRRFCADGFPIVNVVGLVRGFVLGPALKSELYELTVRPGRQRMLRRLKFGNEPLTGMNRRTAALRIARDIGGDRKGGKKLNV